MKKIEPNWRNPKYIYIPAVATNVLARFKALGWKPPSEKLRNH